MSTALNLVPQFRLSATGEPSEEQMRALSQASKLQAKKTEAELREFYKNPFGNHTARFWLAEFSLDYLRHFKPEGSKRKDRPTESILHELNPARFVKALFLSGKLPAAITYKMEDDNATGEKNSVRIELPKSLQSIERLFCAIHIHDLDEDFRDSSSSHFLDYIYRRIDAESRIPPELKQQLKAEAHEDAKSMIALTFGRKTRDGKGQKIRVPTHNNDRQRYSDELEAHWPAIAAKAPDRDDGLRTRYGYSRSYFTIPQDQDYLEETRRLFMYRQALEIMQERYPELSEYFEIMNSRIDIALRCLGVITAHHPTTLNIYPDATIHPETARIDIPKRLLQKATQGLENFDGGCDPFLARMLLGFQLEAQRYPVLRNIVKQMESQLAPYVTHCNPRPTETYDPAEA